MDMKKKNAYLPVSAITVIAVLFLALLPACQPKSEQIQIQEPKLVITPDDMDPDETAVAEAFEDAITGREDVLAFLIYDVNIDNIAFNNKKDNALIWISFTDPVSGDLIPAEAGLVLARKIKDAKEGNPWEITLQVDEDWQEVLNAMPEKLIDAETKEQFSNRQQSIPHAAQVFKGYRLPWATGETKKLSGSIGHVYLYKSCPTTCLYAFDFYDGTMWNILAAKGGRVKYAEWKYPNGNTKHANYIVIEDTSTNPTTYQVYYHLAQDSIPSELRKPGAKVVQGQKIGVVDDTGYSTGHHLHFMVHTTAGSVWGTSVDIVFDEVKVNGGRPRTCNEAKLFPSLGKECAKNDSYVSKNNDYQDPVGKISAPADQTTITSPTFEVKGTATDDYAIQTLQVLLSIDGAEWITASDVDVSTLTNKGGFTTSVDLCTLGIPDGNFFIQLNVIDKAFKNAAGTPGLRTLTKQFECPLPEPKCNAAPSQVGLFEKADFQGECVLLDAGAYELGSQQLAGITSLGSIQVGGEVYSEIVTTSGQYTFAVDSFEEGALGFTFADLQTMVVAPRPPIPQPQAISIYDQTEDESLIADGSITAAWEILDPSHEYRATVYQGEEIIQQLDWTKENIWPLSALEPGSYALNLETHNISGDAISSIEFIVLEADPAPVTSLNELPAESDSTLLRLGWTVEEGLEDLQYVEIRYKANDKDWQLLGQFPPQITSTDFIGNPGVVYEFQLRGVDLAGNSEDFHAGPASIVTISDACTPDAYELNGEGDDSPDLATRLTLKTAQEHNICELGDHDYFTFQANKDAEYRITISPGSQAGAFQVNLYDSALVEPVSETASPGNGEDAVITWKAPASETWYLDVSASDPEMYGEQSAYTIKLEKLVQVTSPGVVIPATLVPLLLALLAASRKFFTITITKRKP
jgi:hypothetical protein